MGVRKRHKVKENPKRAGNQMLERFHRELLRHPEGGRRDAAGSLAQPSFLKQVDSRGVAHAAPVKVSPVVSGQ